MNASPELLTDLNTRRLRRLRQAQFAAMHYATEGLQCAHVPGLPAVYYVHSDRLYAAWWKSTGKCVAVSAPVSTEPVEITVMGDVYRYEPSTCRMVEAYKPAPAPSPDDVLQRQRVHQPLYMNMREATPEKIGETKADAKARRRMSSHYAAKAYRALLRFTPSGYAALPYCPIPRAYRVIINGAEPMLEVLSPTAEALQAGPDDPVSTATRTQVHRFTISRAYGVPTVTVQGVEFTLAADRKTVAPAGASTESLYGWATPTADNMARVQQQAPMGCSILPGAAAWYSVASTGAGATVGWHLPSGQCVTEYVNLVGGETRWQGRRYTLIQGELKLDW